VLVSTPHPHPKSSSTFTMAFKLHGWSISTCTRRVALIAKERNVPYEIINVNLQAGEHKQPAYLAHQPFGQIPYISVRRSHSPLALSFPSLMRCRTFPGYRRVAGRRLRAVRVACYRSLPRDPRVRPRANPHGAQGTRQVRASGGRRIFRV
jgi:hypothetical protein